MGEQSYTKHAAVVAMAKTMLTMHKARTSGLEYVVFTYGKANNAVVFKKNLGELVKYVGPCNHGREQTMHYTLSRF